MYTRSQTHFVYTILFIRPGKNTYKSYRHNLLPCSITKVVFFLSSQCYTQKEAGYIVPAACSAVTWLVQPASLFLLLSHVEVLDWFPSSVYFFQSTYSA